MTTILHISDLHFGWEGNDPNGKAERKVCLDSLLNEISKLEEPWKPSIICLSGDLGWSSASSDYTEAKTWLNSLLEKCGIDYSRLIICPGNHDVDRKLAEKIPRPASTAEANKVLEVPIANHFILSFQRYIDFCKDCDIPALVFGDEKSYLVGTREIDNIRFLVFNSAWFSKDKEDQNKLRLGFPHMIYMEAKGQFPLVQFDGAETIAIALAHHPYDWLHEDEKTCQSFKRPSTWDYLAYRCHVVLTGHTHGAPRPAGRIITDGAHYITGGSAYDGASHFNSIQLLQIQQRKIIYRWLEFDPRSPENKWRSSDAKSLSLVTEKLELRQQEETETKLTTIALRSALSAHVKRFADQKSRLLRPFGDLPRHIPQQVSLEVSRQYQEFNLQGRMVRKDHAEFVIPFYEAVRKARRTLLLGDLGTGKSTLAANLILETIARSETAVAALIPVKLLRLVGHFTQHDLMQSVDDYLRKEVVPSLPKNKVGTLLQQQIEVLLVFDGLDELSRDIAARLLSKASELPDQWPTIQVVATARPVELAGASYADWTVVHTVPLDDTSKQQFIREELIADGIELSIVNEKSSALLRFLKEHTSLNTLAGSPLAIRLIYPRLSAVSSSKGSFTLGELLYELLLERFGGWQKRDDKPFPFEHLETILPTSEAKAEYLAVIAQKVVLGVHITLDEAKTRLEDAAITFQGANKYLLVKEALDCFEWLGLIVKGEAIEFPLQPLAEVSAAVGLLKQWRSQGGEWTIPGDEQWRIVSFVASIARRRGLLDEMRDPLKQFIVSLLRGGRYKIPAACYVVTEAGDTALAKEVIKGFEQFEYRPLTVFGDEPNASARNVAKTIWLAGSVGFDWLYSQYLDPRFPIPHAGSGTIGDIFREWAMFAKESLSDSQKEQLSRMIMPYLSTGEASFFGVLNILVLLVPEAFSMEDRVWHQLHWLDNAVLGEKIKEELLIAGNTESSRTLLHKLLLLRVSESPQAGCLWLELHPGVDPIIPIVRLAFKLNSRSAEHTAASKVISDCSTRLGKERWLRFARWFLSDDDKKVAAGAAIVLFEAGETELAILGDVLLQAIHDGDYTANAEKILELQIQSEGEKGRRWLASRIANSSEWQGAHSGWWRLLLRELEQLEDGPKILAACVRNLGPFTLPRYPEVREAFSRLFDGKRGKEFRNVLQIKIKSLDPLERRGAAVILVTTGPRTEADALFAAIRARADRMNHYWDEWEEFCLTLDYSPSVLEVLRSRLHLLDNQARALALTILTKRGLKVELYQNELFDALQTLGNWRLAKEPVNRAFLETDSSYARLIAQLDKPSSEVVSQAAEQLLNIHKFRLSLKDEAKCIALRHKPAGWEWELPQLMIRVVRDKKFADALTDACKEIESQGTPTPFLGLLLHAVTDSTSWKDVVWAMLCDDSGMGISSEADSSGQALMEFGFEVEEHRMGIGNAAKECLLDPRMQANRWVDAYHWLAVIADEFVGLEPAIINDALRHSQPIQCSAATALIARLGKVPDGVTFDREARRRHPQINEYPLNKTDRPDLIQRLRDYSRDSEELHPLLISTIAESLFMSPIEEQLLADITSMGKPGALISLTLRYCYGTQAKLEDTIPLLDLWGKIWRDDQKHRSLKRLEKIWMRVRESVLHNNAEAAEEYLSTLDNKLLEGKIWALAIAFEILRIRGGLLKEQVRIVLRDYAKHSSFLHETLFGKLVGWIDGELDDTLKAEILDASNEALVVLNETKWDSSDGLYPNTCAYLFFPTVYWILSGVATEESKGVFLRGLKSSFELLSKQKKNAQKELDHISYLSPLLKRVPIEIIGDTIRNGLTASEPSVSSFCTLIQQFADFMVCDRNPSEECNL